MKLVALLLVASILTAGTVSCNIQCIASVTTVTVNALEIKDHIKRVKKVVSVVKSKLAKKTK